jgi:hypothetical protein
MFSAAVFRAASNVAPERLTMKFAISSSFSA